MENNGTVDALAELIRGANLTYDQRAALLRLSRSGSDGSNGHAKKTGPYAHCKFGDQVRVRYPDNTEDILTVSKSSAIMLKISRQSAEVLKQRMEDGFQRAKNNNFIKARDEKWEAEHGGAK